MIYTKTGDKGFTSLVEGTRVPKYDIRIETYGSVDELNSYLAVVAEYAKPINMELYEYLKTIQRELFTIQTLLATKDEEMCKKLPQLPSQAIARIEGNIDKIDGELPRLQSFVIPGGSVVSAHTHVARCICRRCERLYVKLASEQPVASEIGVYLNRLSDYLFVLSRFFLKLEGKQEEYFRSVLELIVLMDNALGYSEKD